MNQDGFYLNYSFSRCSEILISAGLLIVSLPLLLSVALLIKWESPGPILHGRDRITRNGHRSRILTFRTTRYEPGSLTNIGRFLQLTRIEVLPQVINVLRGDVRLADTDLYE